MTAEEARRLYDKIDALKDHIEQKLAAIAIDVGAIKAACEPCKSDVDRLKVTVYGGEREGLATKVGRNTWLANGIAAVIGGAIVAAVSALF